MIKRFTSIFVLTTLISFSFVTANAQEFYTGSTPQNSDMLLALTVEGQKYTGNAQNVVAVLKVTVTGDIRTANEARTELPEELSVQGSYPNPFRKATSIVYNLPAPAQVYAEVFDMLGRVVYTSSLQQVEAGWGRSLSLNLPSTRSGLYVYRVNAGTASGILIRTGRIIQVR